MTILKKKIPLIDQHDKFGFYCNGKFGGNFVAETARKPIHASTQGGGNANLLLAP